MASTIKSNTVTNATASTLTLGESGTTVTLACGATQSGFGRTGTVDWCTTVKTSPLTAVSGKGYFINTTGGAVTVTLPSSPTAGDIVSLKDYADTWATACKAVTLGRGGSKIGGECLDADLATAGQSVTMIYVDGTKGWENIQTDTTIKGAQFVAATGGTITTVCTNYKVHTFLASGCFQVTDAGGPSGSNTVDYLVVAGGGGGSASAGSGNAGAGAGGYRESPGAASGCYTVSPLGASPAVALPVSVSTYPITVGAGGAGGPQTTGGVNGTNSIFSTITSAGGGGAGGNPSNNGKDGGSGGGAGRDSTLSGGTGNTPPVSPAQGKNGGLSNNPGGNAGAGGGGGALVAGSAPPSGCGPAPEEAAGPGGGGATSSINGTPTARAGGGGGGTYYDNGAPQVGAGGAGGGGGGGGVNSGVAGTAGTANTGGGGGGGGPAGGVGGSGVVIIRYKFQ